MRAFCVNGFRTGPTRRPGTALHGAQTVPGAEEAVTRTLDAAAVARSRLLGNFPEEAARLVLAGLRADGVEIRLHTATTSVSENDDGTFTLGLGDGSSVSANKVLVSTGRHPALEGLGLESIGLGATDGNPLKLATDSTGLVIGMTDGGPWLYAMGDAAGKTSSPTRANTRRGPQGMPSPHAPRVN